jgi:hypothetical protein
MLDTPLRSAAEALERAHAVGDTRVAFDADRLLECDSGLLIFLRGVLVDAQRRRMSVDFGGLPDGAQRLLALANATPEHPGVARDDDRSSILGRIPRSDRRHLTAFISVGPARPAASPAGPSSPAVALVAQNCCHFLVAELVGECRHRAAYATPPMVSDRTTHDRAAFE